jgi:hypothetical protein
MHETTIQLDGGFFHVTIMEQIITPLSITPLRCTFQDMPSHTESRGRVTSTPYHGGPGLKSRSRIRLFLTEDFPDFPQSIQANSGILPQIN